MKLCKCGCGNETNNGKDYIKTHSSRVKKYLKKSIVCQCGCGKMTKKGNSFLHGHNRQGTTHTEDEKKRIKETNLKTYSNPELLKLFQGENNKFFGKKHSVASHKIMKEKAQERCSDPLFIEKIASTTKAALSDPIKRKKISINSIAMWKNPVSQKRLKDSLKIKPNKEEVFLHNLLEKMHPGEWKYTGDFSFIINGKCPDFVNCNGQKKIIEYNGTYWHKNDIPGKREKMFAEFGYSTLIIWDTEMKNIESVKNKIERFYEL